MYSTEDAINRKIGADEFGDDIFWTYKTEKMDGKYLTIYTIEEDGGLEEENMLEKGLIHFKVLSSKEVSQDVKKIFLETIFTKI